MNCQNCGKNPANTHFTQNINGSVTESWLCAECAEKLGIGDMFSSSFANFGSLGGFGSFGGLSSLLGSMLDSSFGLPSSVGALPSATKCPQCGSTFDDIVNRGMVGCADCYEQFSDRLEPSIERLHGRASHVGKNASNKTNAKEKPKNTPDNSTPVQGGELARLKSQLKDAISKEEYEKAAQLRDQIRKLEEKQ